MPSDSHNTKPKSSDVEPFERIKDVNEIQNDVRQMQENLRRLQEQLRQLEWGRLGGFAVFDPAEAHKLCIVTAENLEHIADEIDGLSKRTEDADE